MIALGIYEKALPKESSWEERLLMVKSLGFDFIEMSIDETDERLARLDWGLEKRQQLVQTMLQTGVKINSICLSGHRRYPLGSIDPAIRHKAIEIMEKAIKLAADIGVGVIQLAGYDVYYEAKSVTTRSNFIMGLKKAVALAAKYQITLAIEIMDDPFVNSITSYLHIKKQVPSPWLKVYPDLGNLSAWPENNVGYELELGQEEIVAIHLKDTLAVTADYAGKFKEVPFGAGCVDFAGCLQTLKGIDYNGPFLIEMWSENSENPLDEIERAKVFVRSYLKEAGYE